LIGGATPDARNLISGNTGDGVQSEAEEESIVIRGNFIGTDKTGTAAIPNGGSGFEVSRQSSDPLGLEIRDNVVSGNNGPGIHIFTFFQDEDLRAHVLGNLIGTDVSGLLPLGNRSTGLVLFATFSVISGNTIAFNGFGDPAGGGVLAVSSDRLHGIDCCTIRGNSIFENTSDGSVPGGGQGILGDNSNILCMFREEGGITEQNFPALTYALADGSEIRIRGTLNTGLGARIEFFSNTACDPSGYGEGQTFIGFTDVFSDDLESCNADYDVTLPVAVEVGQSITATATGVHTFQGKQYFGGTSQFSNCVPVQEAARVGVVNPLVKLLSVTTSRNPKTIRAKFKNTSSTPIDSPFFVVTQLTGGLSLLNADTTPGGVGARLTPNVGSDHVFSPGETLVAEFVVGNPFVPPRPFNFFVDLWGETNP